MNKENFSALNKLVDFVLRLFIDLSLYSTQLKTQIKWETAVSFHHFINNKLNLSSVKEISI